MVTSIPFQFDRNRNKQVDTYRRSYLSDGQVDRCHDTKCYHIISQCLTYRQHDRDKDVHGRVCINKASCDQEDHGDDQKEYKLVMRYASEQIGSCLCDTEFGTYEREQGSTPPRSA